jgi:hypothetical protein
MGKVPEALKRLEEHDPTKRRHGGLRRAMNERQVVRGGSIEFFQFVVTEG